ncbi:hypothetical protein DN069_21005 [Streptacidiphilus pinicola]|uniref:Lipoprotein n=2 Tax=Streptacidiphilus pinicola TaxID=2219663 RepID=A0A2X0K7Y2_9ACTN|nr:hypothetical protein DN069_21005 [Streptacidiphilus pinicola]
MRLAALAIAGTLLTCCSAGTGSGAATSSSPSGGAGSAPTTAPPTYPGVKVPITAVLVQDGGLKLTTQTLGGGCRRLSLQAQESATDVRLTLTVTRPSGICPPYVTLVEVSTTLHAPLGTRQLVDASTGRPITSRSG